VKAAVLSTIVLEWLVIAVIFVGTYSVFDPLGNAHHHTHSSLQ